MLRPSLRLLAFSASALLWSAAVFGAPASDRFREDITLRPFSQLAVEQFPDVVDALSARGNYERALQAVEAGLQRNPRSAQLRFQRCVVLERMGSLGEAKAELEAFIRLYPEIPEGYNNLAVIESREGDLDAAEAHVKRAINFRPSFRQAHVNLANIYLARAKASLQTAQNIRSEKAVQAKLQTIDSLLSR